MNLGGILIMSLLGGLLNSAIYKWIPKIFAKKGNAGPVGGVTGSLGAMGGFFIPIVFGLFGTKATSVFSLTALCVTMLLLCWYLRSYENNLPKEKKKPVHLKIQPYNSTM